MKRTVIKTRSRIRTKNWPGEHLWRTVYSTDTCTCTMHNAIDYTVYMYYSQAFSTIMYTFMVLLHYAVSLLYVCSLHENKSVYDMNPEIQFLLRQGQVRGRREGRREEMGRGRRRY